MIRRLCSVSLVAVLLRFAPDETGATRPTLGEDGGSENEDRWARCFERGAQPSLQQRMRRNIRGAAAYNLACA